MILPRRSTVPPIKRPMSQISPHCRKVILYVTITPPDTLRASLLRSIKTSGHGPTTTRDVAFPLDDGVLRGQVEVTANLRLSDHLRQHGPYNVLRQGMLAPYGGTLLSSGSKVATLRSTESRSTWPSRPVTFPVTTEPALAGAGWRCRGAQSLIHAGGRWPASGLGG
jgi:hypothetical protein